MEPVSVVEQVKYNDCVKALNSAPVSVGGQIGFGFTPVLSHFSEYPVHIYTLLLSAVAGLLSASDFSV